MSIVAAIPDQRTHLPLRASLCSPLDWHQSRCFTCLTFRIPCLPHAPQTESFLLPSGQEVEADSLAAPDLAEVQRRMKGIIRVLDNFAALREPGRSRQEYLAQLKRDLQVYYGYNDYMLEAMLNMFTVRTA